MNAIDTGFAGAMTPVTVLRQGGNVVRSVRSIEQLPKTLEEQFGRVSIGLGPGHTLDGDAGECEFEIDLQGQMRIAFTGHVSGSDYHPATGLRAYVTLLSEPEFTYSH